MKSLGERYQVTKREGIAALLHAIAVKGAQYIAAHGQTSPRIDADIRALRLMEMRYYAVTHGSYNGHGARACLLIAPERAARILALRALKTAHARSADKMLETLRADILRAGTDATLGDGVDVVSVAYIAYATAGADIRSVDVRRATYRAVAKYINAQRSARARTAPGVDTWDLSSDMSVRFSSTLSIDSVESAIICASMIDVLAASPRDRAIIRMRYAGVVQADIAAKMGISQPTVSRALDRIRARAVALGLDSATRAVPSD